VLSALILWVFGVFFFRSTVKTYYREARKKYGLENKRKKSIMDEIGAKALFTGGFSVGSVETLEAMIVLLALTTGGFGWEALFGFIGGGVLLLTLGYMLHEQIRKIKVAPLKWFGSTMIFTFAVFWTGEALDYLKVFEWPTLLNQYPDIFLIPLFVLTLFAVWLAVDIRVEQKIRPDMADVLSNRGKAFLEKGDLEGSIENYRDSAKKYRSMIDDGEVQLLPQLADVLNNLGNALGDKGDIDGEVASYRESAKIRQSLVDGGKDDILPDLARVLNNLGAALGESGKVEGAATSLKDSQRIYRALVDGGKDQFLPDLAEVQGNLGRALGDKDDLDGAIACYRESEKEYRSLIGGGKDQFLPDLANNLTSLGKALEDKGDLDGAISTYIDAERRFRALVDGGKSQYVPNLARVRNSLEAARKAKGGPDKPRANL
jgi:tetratricopeptide (TPR) repeat protein